MKLRKIIKSNNALAGVIEALLIVALIAIIIAFIQQYYVPEIMKQKESEHMDQVSNQFSNLKSVIEIQAMTGSIEDTQLAYTPISSPITLGSSKLPYFVTTGSSGQIYVNGQSDVTSEIEISDPHPDFINGIPLTSVRYNSENYYYISDLDQQFILEGGGIILDQRDGQTMRVNPAITVQNLTNEIKVNFFLPAFNQVQGKDSYSGFKDIYIRTNFSKVYSTHEDTSTDEITIYSEYIEAWNFSFNNVDTGLFREYADQGYINIVYDTSSPTPYIQITPNSKQIHLILDVVEIGIQIGPGFVITN